MRTCAHDQIHKVNQSPLSLCRGAPVSAAGETVRPSPAPRLPRRPPHAALHRVSILPPPPRSHEKLTREAHARISTKSSREKHRGGEVRVAHRAARGLVCRPRGARQRRRVLLSETAKNALDASHPAPPLEPFDPARPGHRGAAGARPRPRGPARERARRAVRAGDGAAGLALMHPPPPPPSY